jgi:hypothetical protein
MNRDMKLDPYVAKIIDEFAELPLIKLDFPAHIKESVKSDIEEIFEKIRPKVEHELIKQGLL